METTQKLYAYVDESGQDTLSAFFVVVVVINDRDQDSLRKEIILNESASQTGHRKWHKSRPDRRIRFIKRAIEHRIAFGEVFYGVYPKPIPYFFPMVDLLEYAILQKATNPYFARIYVDGIDLQKAAELTNALRARSLTVRLVKGRRDESEPLIRLADMWVGCIRAALLGRTAEQAILQEASNIHYLKRKTPAEQG